MKEFIPFIQAVGRGEKLKRDLTVDEAQEAMRLILSGRVEPAQIGAFLIAHRVKGESVEEIVGFTQAVRESCYRIQPKVEGLLDLGIPYDGKAKSLQLGPVIALVLAAAGQPVVFHGDRDIPTKGGVGPVELLEALDIQVDVPVGNVQHHIEEIGLGFLYAPRFAPAWHQLTPIRHQFGLRTAMNTVEKLVNPANAPMSVSGFFHKNYIVRSLPAVHHLIPQSWIVHGPEGSIECLPGRANPIYSTLPDAELMIVKSDDLLPSQNGNIDAPLNAQFHAAAARQVLENESGPARDTVILTSGVLLFLTKRVSSFAEGVGLAQEAIVTGAARQKLQAWQKITA